MKTSNLTNKIVISVLFIGVVVYFGLYLVQSFSGDLATVIAYQDSVNVGTEATGLLVRQEQVITVDNPSVTVELSPSEGEKVSAGGVVATLYDSASGLDTKSSIQLLEAEIEQLQYSLRASASAVDTAKLERDLLSSIAGLHTNAAQGDLTDLEKDALELRTLVFRRDYTYGDAGAASQLSALIAQKNTELSALRSSLGSVSTTIYAPQSGIFSGLVDGFETLITPAMLSTITPAELLSLQRQTPAVSSSAIGTLTTSSTWYFAAVLTEEEAADLRKENDYTIVFSHDYSGNITMTLDRLSDPQDGRVAAVFSCRSHLSDTTLLRGQTVDIVTSRIQGIRVPRAAVRVLTKTVTDEETGVTSEVTVTGVYAAVSAQAEFKPVNLLYQGEDYYLVEPVDSASSNRLRAGDELILSTIDVFDGKVIRS